MGYAKITHVACLYGGAKFSLPKPNRHSDIWLMLIQMFPNIKPNDDIRGFLDANGNWLTREGAYIRAQKTGQIKISKSWKENHPGKYHPGLLYSEDIW